MHSANEPGDLPRRKFRPRLTSLEERVLMAIDLANVAGPPSTGGPYGIAEFGLQSSNGAGWASAVTGDVLGAKLNARPAYQSVLVGAPNIVPNSSTTPGIPVLNFTSTQQSLAYLILGSNQAVSTGGQAFSWLKIPADSPPTPPNQRNGDLSQLGAVSQSNPLTGSPSFAFNGVVFYTSDNANSLVGASVANLGDINGDGYTDFLIGAPNANSAPTLANPSGNMDGSGRAFIVYGSPTLAQVIAGTPIDLDNPPTGIKVTRIDAQNMAGFHIGSAVANAGAFGSDGTHQFIAIGAQDANITGLAGQGAVWVISNAALMSGGQPVSEIVLDTVGQNNDPSGLLFAGEAAGSGAGASLADAGNTANRTSPTHEELLIGAPDRPLGSAAAVGPGTAYMIYGNTITNFQKLMQTTPSGITYISLGQVASGLTNDVPGALFVGAATGDMTGYAVSTAGDFNRDGLADILIGSPGFGSNRGRATMIYGQKSTTSTPYPLEGVYDLSSLPTSIKYVELQGANTGDLAGFAVSAVRDMNGDNYNEVAVGAPSTIGVGKVYILPGQKTLSGGYSLSNAEAAPLYGLAITNSNPAGANLLGASVASNLGTTSSGFTLDGDSMGDLAIGAPDMTPTVARINAGAEYALEGAYIPLPIPPVPTQITTTIGVDQAPPPPAGGYPVKSTDTTMTIYVEPTSTVTPPFDPITELDPTSLVVSVNGVTVAYPSATFGSSGTDATFTFDPTALKLTKGVYVLSIDAFTTSTATHPNAEVVGSATIVVDQGGGGGGSAKIVGPLFGVTATAALPPYGSRMVPAPSVLYGKFTWRPLSIRKAYQQFEPQGAFRARYVAYVTRAKQGKPIGSSKNLWSGYRTTTLGQHVFTRGKYPTGVFDARTLLHKKK